MADWSSVVKAIAGAKTALVVAHVMPDGDAIGSALGLARLLRAHGIDADVSCVDAVPPELLFLPQAGDFSSRSAVDQDLVFVVDASDLSRAGDLGVVPRRDRQGERQGLGPLVINIDHHATNTHFADIEVVEIRSSTAELILDLSDALGGPLDPEGAECLLTGVVTDTRCFRTSNVEPRTMAAATRLMEAGAELSKVTDAVYNHRSMDVVRLWGAALSAAVLDDGVLWCAIPLDMLQDAGADSGASGGLVSFLSEMHLAQIAAVFREVGDGTIDVSLRSRLGVDVSGVAVRFGGGGHAQAAGCQVEGELDAVRKDVVAALRPVAGSRPLSEPKSCRGR